LKKHKFEGPIYNIISKLRMTGNRIFSDNSDDSADAPDMEIEADSYFDEYYERVISRHAAKIARLNYNAEYIERKRRRGICRIEENGLFLWDVRFDDTGRVIEYSMPLNEPYSADVYVENGQIVRIDIMHNYAYPYPEIEETRNYPLQ
jgi:hypothetical protein